MTTDGGIIKQSTARNVIENALDVTNSRLQELHERNLDEALREYYNDLDYYSGDTDTTNDYQCSLCKKWGSNWVELDILGDSEIYCIDCTSKGIHEIHI